MRYRGDINKVLVKSTGAFVGVWVLCVVLYAIRRATFVPDALWVANIQAKCGNTIQFYDMVLMFLPLPFLSLSSLYGLVFHHKFYNGQMDRMTPTRNKHWKLFFRILVWLTLTIPSILLLIFLPVTNSICLFLKGLLPITTFSFLWLAFSD